MTIIRSTLCKFEWIENTLCFSYSKLKCSP